MDRCGWCYTLGFLSCTVISAFTSKYICNVKLFSQLPFYEYRQVHRLGLRPRSAKRPDLQRESPSVVAKPDARAGAHRSPQGNVKTAPLRDQPVASAAVVRHSDHAAAASSGQRVAPNGLKEDQTESGPLRRHPPRSHEGHQQKVRAVDRGAKAPRPANKSPTHSRTTTPAASTQGQAWQKCEMTRGEKQRWKGALREAQPLTWDTTKRTVPILPVSWMNQIRQLNHTKIRKWHFFGSMFTGDVNRYRHWIPEFARKNFRDPDMLLFTDPPKNKKYERLGEFDQTSILTGFREKSVPKSKRFVLDLQYFQTMAQSKFVLCPRGDASWSMRVYEAIASGAIPVVRSLKVDWVRPSCMMTNIPYTFYCLGPDDDAASLHFDPHIAEDNLRLFMRYQTLSEGENVPSPRSFARCAGQRVLL